MENEFERLESWLSSAKDDLTKKDSSEYLSKLMILDAEIKAMLRKRTVLGGRPRRKRYVFGLAALSLTAVVLFVAVAVQLANVTSRIGPNPTNIVAIAPASPSSPTVTAPAKPEPAISKPSTAVNASSPPRPRAHTAHSRRAARNVPEVALQPRHVPAPSSPTAPGKVEPSAPAPAKASASKLNALELLAKMEDEFSRKNKGSEK
jgi:hypothetical protein